MKEKIKLAFATLYLAAFYRGVIELLKLPDSFVSGIDLLIGIVIVYLGLSTFNYKYNLTFRVYLFIVLFISTFTFIINGYSLVEHINGLREIIYIFLVFSFIHKVYLSGNAQNFNKRFHKFAIIFLTLQIPWSFYQYIAHGAGDYVGGSLAWGGSGRLTLCIFLLVYYLTDRYKEMNNGKIYSYYFIYFVPTFINETKISFILLPFFFLSITSVFRFSSLALGLIFAVVSLFAINDLYSDNGQTWKNPIEHIFNKSFLTQDFIANASTKAPTVGQENDVPRITKIIISATLFHTPEDILFGKEYGAFKGGNILGVSKFSRRYNWLLRGTRPYFFYLLISGGWLLVATIIYFFLSVMRRINVKTGEGRAPWFIVAFFLLFLVYLDCLRDPFVLFVFVFMVIHTKYRQHLQLS